MLGPYQARVEERIKENLPQLQIIHFSNDFMHIEIEA